MVLDAVALERVIIDALMPPADAVLIDTPTWAQLSSASVPDATANGVYLAKLGEDEADARIAEIKRSHDARGFEFRWVVGPSSTPADLPERLRRAGLVEFGAALGMSMAVPDEDLPIPEGVELHEVGPDEVEAFAALSVLTWERDPAFGNVVVSTIRRALEWGRDAQRSWLVTLDGQRVGTTTLRLLPKQSIGYLQGAAVVPERRRAGIYRAMVHHRLSLLRELGYRHAVIWANERTSALACERIGFRRQCRAVFFESRRPDPNCKPES